MEITWDKYLIGAILGALFYYFWTRLDYYKFSFKVPCVWGLPFVGVFLKIGHINNVFKFFEEQFKIHKDRSFLAWMSVTPFLLTVDPKVIEQLLTSSELVEKGRSFYTPVNKGVNGALVALPAKRWPMNRKLLSPLLRPKQLLNFFPILNTRARGFAKMLDEICTTGKERDILKEIRFCTLHMTLETTMDYEIEMSPEELDKFLDTLIILFRHLGYEAFLNCAHLRKLINFKPSFRKTTKNLYNFGNKIITDSVKKFMDLGKDNIVPNEDDIKNRKYIFPGQLLKYSASGEVQWDDVVGSLNGLMIGSFETTTNTLFSLLALIAMHPEVQEKLYEEVCAAFPEKDFEVKYEDLRNLNYMEMVINEILRLYPPVPILGRTIMNNTTTLQINGKSLLLPKGMQIIVPLYQLHRETSVWGDRPNDFNPDNFLPHKVADRSPYEFLPFSKGPRNCIGWNYAYYSMKVMLSHILRNYKVMTDFQFERYKVNLTIFLEIEHEPHLVFERRP